MKRSTTYLVAMLLVVGSASCQSKQGQKGESVASNSRSMAQSIICSDSGQESSYPFATAPRLRLISAGSSGYHYSIRIDRDDSNVVITATGPDYEIQSSSASAGFQILRSDSHHLLANIVEDSGQTTSVVTYQLDMVSDQSGVLSRVQTLVAGKGSGMASLSTWGCKLVAPVP